MNNLPILALNELKVTLRSAVRCRKLLLATNGGAFDGRLSGFASKKSDLYKILFEKVLFKMSDFEKIFDLLHGRQ